jgi:leucyl/phenylalanyl-tRNA--protein transferase
VTGDLDPRVVLAAYAEGWFPMDVDGVVGWYETDPRVVIPLDGFRVPRSVRRALRAAGFAYRVDTAFDAVVAACGGERHGGAWLTPRLAGVYGALHRAGHAHSVEVWRDGELVGGLFGVALGGLYTSESMFHRASDAGSAALVATHAHLARRGFALWDVQMASPHTERFGAVGVSPAEYRRRLAVALTARPRFGPPGPLSER